MIVNNSMNINKTNDHLWLQNTEHENIKIYCAGNPGPYSHDSWSLLGRLKGLSSLLKLIYNDSAYINKQYITWPDSS